ncbi:MAG: hypothetical protein U1F52_03340 [Burkholderiales bacterium]
METDLDIAEFVERVGAKEPLQNDESYSTFRRMFKRHNYFTLNGRFLIIKVSRSKRPFWGVGKDFIDFLNGLPNYYLVLLVPGCEGWVFSKEEVGANILDGKWGLGADNDYKINVPLRDTASFAGPKTFKRKIGIDEP